jgi:hypothetical protein
MAWKQNRQGKDVCGVGRVRKATFVNSNLSGVAMLVMSMCQ